MTYCEKCGAENLKSDLFCKRCGNRLTQNPGNNAGAAPRAFQLSDNPAVHTLKAQGSSGKCLAAALLYSAMLLFQLIHAFQGMRAYDGLLGSIGDLVGGLESIPLVGRYYEQANRVVVGLNLLWLVPTIFILIGIWLLYLSCRDRSTGGVATAGATIIKVVAVIHLVLICLIFLAIEAALIAAAVQVFGSSHPLDPYTPTTTYYGSSMLMAFLAVLAAGIGALFILYYASILSILGSIKKAALTGKPSEVRLATYLGVMNFILAVFSVIGGALSGNAVDFFSNAFYAAFLIVAALIVFTYRDSMRKLCSLPSSPTGILPPVPEEADADR